MFWKKKKKKSNPAPLSPSHWEWWRPNSSSDPGFYTGFDGTNSASCDPGTPADPSSPDAGHHGGSHHGGAPDAGHHSCASHSSGHSCGGHSCGGHGCGGHGCGGGH